MSDKRHDPAALAILAQRNQVKCYIISFQTSVFKKFLPAGSNEKLKLD
jgi:hypothetical protein